jgi:hypothetical protein
MKHHRKQNEVKINKGYIHIQYNLYSQGKQKPQRTKIPSKKINKTKQKIYSIYNIKQNIKHTLKSKLTLIYLNTADEQDTIIK